MQDVELYRQLLGLNTPWTVTRVELKVKEQRVEVWAGHAESARWPCPECAMEVAVYDHAEERASRHLGSCQFQTYLHARPPRVQCPSHGVRQVRLPWAEPRARFTTLFERQVTALRQVVWVISAQIAEWRHGQSLGSMQLSILDRRYTSSPARSRTRRGSRSYQPRCTRPHVVQPSLLTGGRPERTQACGPRKISRLRTRMESRTAHTHPTAAAVVVGDEHTLPDFCIPSRARLAVSRAGFRPLGPQILPTHFDEDP